MNKNRIYSFTAITLILSLLSVFVISGTYAKYTDGDTGSDGVRVSKWGVNVEVWNENDTMFTNTYSSDTSTFSEATVTSTTDAIVAPGTKCSKGISFTVTGAPEVAIEVVIDMQVKSDIFVPEGKVGLSEDYYPVKFTLCKGESKIISGNLTDIANFIKSYSGKFPPGKNLSESIGTYTLIWEWAFNGNDVADTYLGNLASETIKDDECSTALEFDLSISVTQIN